MSQDSNNRWLKNFAYELPVVCPLFKHARALTLTTINSSKRLEPKKFLSTSTIQTISMPNCPCMLLQAIVNILNTSFSNQHHPQHHHHHHYHHHHHHYLHQHIIIAIILVSLHAVASQSGPWTVKNPPS